MKKIELIIRPEKLEPLKKILSKNEYSGLTVMSAMGCGHQKGYSEEFKKLGMEINLLPKNLHNTDSGLPTVRSLFTFFPSFL